MQLVSELVKLTDISQNVKHTWSVNMRMWSTLGHLRNGVRFSLSLMGMAVIKKTSSTWCPRQKGVLIQSTVGGNVEELIHSGKTQGGLWKT